MSSFGVRDSKELDHERRKRLSRGEIELLCVIRIVGAGGLSSDEVVLRLGLSSSLRAPIVAALQELALTGLLDVEGDRVSVTALGVAWEKERLEDLGIAHAR